MQVLILVILMQRGLSKMKYQVILPNLITIGSSGTKCWNKRSDLSGFATHTNTHTCAHTYFCMYIHTNIYSHAHRISKYIINLRCWVFVKGPQFEKCVVFEINGAMIWCYNKLILMFEHCY